LETQAPGRLIKKPVQEEIRTTRFDIKRRKKKTIEKSALVIENDLHLRNNIVAILEHFDLKIITAKNGKEGIKKYKKHMHKIIVVIMDFSMPQISGTNLIEKLIKLNPKVKIIVCAKGKQLDKIQPSYMKNVIGILEIPFKSPTLAILIKKALR
jgi:two-component system CheB/CheR fusion protein